MPAAYSGDLRERVVGSVNEGSSRRRAGAVFKVSASSAVRWAQRFKDTGTWQAKPVGGGHRSKGTEANKDWLLALVGAEPDLTLAEVQSRLSSGKAAKPSTSALLRFFDRHGIRFKKKPARRRAGPRGREGGARCLAAGTAVAGSGPARLH